IRNPAFYDPSHNRVVCGTDLQQLEAELDELRRNNEELRNRLNEQEEQWLKQFKGKIPQDFQKKLSGYREQIAKANEENEKTFGKATERLFRTLYHEAFHAYLANFVYLPAEARVPRWLNEGLAQIFETALIEAGELRLGHADPQRLTQVKAAVRSGEFVPLKSLLRAGPKHFLVNHASDQQISDQYYQASWALAFYLTFERKMLGSPELGRYVHVLKEQGTDPLAAFCTLVG